MDGSATRGKEREEGGRAGETEAEGGAEMGMRLEEPTEAHRWLEKLLGEWEMIGEADSGTDGPPEKAVGTETVRTLGGIWYQLEGTHEMPNGETGVSVMTLGYDTRRKRYVGSWIGTMMTNQWVYEGELDDDGRVLTLNTEGPAMSGEGKTASYRDVIEFRSDDHRVLTSHVQGDDGEWKQMVEVHYRRKE